MANVGWRGAAQAAHHHEAPSQASMPTGSDPLVEFDKDEMVRLCHVYHDEMGIMYPVLDIGTVIGHAMRIAPFLESARTQLRPPALVNDDETLQLKMVMCCALLVEQHGNSDKAVRLYQSVDALVNQKLMADVGDVANLPLLCLVAGYRFLSNDEVLAWRVIGHVSRLCVELGIHQKRGLLRIKDEAQKKNALNCFWSSYVLDRRWAFATGLPFAVQDDEIDPQQPFPVSKRHFPHLTAEDAGSDICRFPCAKDEHPFSSP